MHTAQRSSRMSRLPKLMIASQVHRELAMEATPHEVKNGQSEQSCKVVRSKSHNTDEWGQPAQSYSRRCSNQASILGRGSDQGIPLNRYHLLQLFCQVAAGLGLKNHGFDNKYVRRFLTRQCDLSLQITTLPTGKKTGNGPPYAVKSIYPSWINYKRIPRPTRASVEPRRDAFNTSEMYDRVIARKGAKHIPSQFDGNEKENVTILPCAKCCWSPAEVYGIVCRGSPCSVSFG
ncbi:hypothetical protein RvY_19224 [Ramazzottius varieornatus]|uniref:Uncharacterized protein n=1 Tax=Ramazzottius varieornatus TaxID=947166 RepID=A0A1D1W8P6_RAMVA|nr:hypothetical protein RvY_19224 [Ramazzottius varieornatus]